jgi:16S rRNA (cytosine967-C5)-methyltransferase
MKSSITSENNPRLIATHIIHRVIYHGESLRPLLAENEAATDSLVRDLCFGSLRWHERLSAVLNTLMPKPLKKKDKDVECLLRIGLYQIIYQQTPDHAAVNETVASLNHLKKQWAKKLINAVLRHFLRRKESLLQQIDNNDATRYAFPEWLIGKIKKAWPNDWQYIANASNQRAPMVLRVNALHYRQDEYCKKLNQCGIPATVSTICDTAVILEKPVNVQELPEFNQGAVSVQDTAAQLAAGLLDIQENMHVLDACAAPGGKTGHILEQCQPLHVIAIDSSASRMQRVTENLQRIFPNTTLNSHILNSPKTEKKLIPPMDKKQSNITLLVADAAATDEWAEDLLFDRILLDAPCSATGVIRRHPDIKCLRRADDIKGLQRQQHHLLTQLWKKLKPEGKLLYATCSILPEENEKQIATFVEQTENAIIQTIEAKWGRALRYGRQIFPNESAMDGFYYALIKKKANSLS